MQSTPRHRDSTVHTDPAADTDPTAHRGPVDPTAVLAAYWNESERRLYPVATTNPDAYQAALRLVRLVADSLAGVADLEELATRWEGEGHGLDELAGFADVAIHGLAEREVVGAAFALRRRELLAELAERQRRASIAAARRSGRDWAIIHEQGDLEAGLAAPYQCVELHLPTGLAVVSTVEPDPATMTPRYVVMVSAMAGVMADDPDDEMADDASGQQDRGQGPVIDPASLGELETDDPASFNQNRQTMRSRVESAAWGQVNLGSGAD